MDKWKCITKRQLWGHIMNKVFPYTMINTHSLNLIQNTIQTFTKRYFENSQLLQNKALIPKGGCQPIYLTNVSWGKFKLIHDAKMLWRSYLSRHVWGRAANPLHIFWTVHFRFAQLVHHSMSCCLLSLLEAVVQLPSIIWRKSAGPKPTTEEPIKSWLAITI